jgi:hypothetical protein
MRLALLTVVAVAAAANGVAIHAAASPPPLISCDSAVLRPPSVNWSDRVVFERVTFSWARVYQIAKQNGRFPYWSKVGLYVRTGRTPVSISVPLAWRRRAAIAWGDQQRPVPILRVPGCPSAPRMWSGYSGGFYVSRPACVPLIVGVAGRRTVVRFGIGRSCRPAG